MYRLKLQLKQNLKWVAQSAIYLQTHFKSPLSSFLYTAKHIHKVFGCLLVLSSACVNLMAQAPVHIQDSIYVSPRSEGEIIPASQFSAYICLKIKYDSTMVYYDFVECKLNSQRIRLQNWWRGVEIDTLEANLMSNLNRTDAISLKTNDTLSFFRNFTWINHFDHTMKQDNYFSRDTLIYIVELLENGSNNRLSLLDSFCVLRKIPSGTPNFLGIQDPFKKVSYIIPSSLNDKEGYIKLSMQTKGDGNFYPARRTGFTSGASLILTHPAKATYREKFGAAGNYKFSATETNEEFISVLPNPSQKHVKLSLKINNKNREGEFSMTLHSISGKPILGFFKLNLKSGTDMEFDLPEKGVYFVTVENETGVIARKKIIIN